MSSELRDPTVWLVIYVAASWLTYIGGIVVYFIVYCGLDSHLIKHDRAEGAVEHELGAIYARLGQTLPEPDPARVKGPHNYVGRILATLFTGGIYLFWWVYNIMGEGNRHFETNWPWEDSLAQAVQALQ